MPELCAYWFTPADALDFCRYANDVIVRMCAAAPGRFIGLGIVPLQDPDMAAKELAHIKSLGFPGVELGSNVNGKSLGMAEFQGFFQEAERLGVAIFVHALRPTMMERFPDQGALQSGRLSDRYEPDDRVDDRRRDRGEVPELADRIQPRRRHLPVPAAALQPSLERHLERRGARPGPRCRRAGGAAALAG